jgi:hypothetical protein
MHITHELCWQNRSTVTRPVSLVVMRLPTGWFTIASMSFDYTLDFNSVDFRRHPELYRIGRGEQGVLLIEPYKSEILPYWRFKTPQIARTSASKIYGKFLEYKAEEDFVGMDMARKFLQMGYTRARRYANHKSGRKYKEGGKELLPREEDTGKAESAKVFYEKWCKAREDKKYLELKKRHREMYGK